MFCKVFIAVTALCFAAAHGFCPSAHLRLALRNVHYSVRDLHSLVRDYSVAVDEPEFCFQQLSQETSAQNLYTGLYLFQQHIERFEQTAEAYMLTDKYATESQVVYVARRAEAVMEEFQTLTRHMYSALEILVLHENVNVSAIVDCPRFDGAPQPLTDLADLYGETAFVAEHLNGFVINYRRLGYQCSTAGRRRRDVSLLSKLVTPVADEMTTN